MSPEVEEKLTKGLEQLIASSSAGIGRSVVSDGYSAIDNYLSALLISEGKENPHNHKKKLSVALNIIATDLKSHNIKQTDIFDFYAIWNSSRYSMKSVSPSDSYKYRHLANEVCGITLVHIAKKHGVNPEDIDKKIYENLLGARWQRYQESISKIHEMWQSNAEEMAELGYGRKIGNKLSNPSNFCELTLISDDETTKNILAETDIINYEVAQLYNSYLELVTKIQNHRIEAGVEVDNVPSFSLSLRMRYSGETIHENADRFTESFAKVLASSLENLTSKSR